MDPATDTPMAAGTAVDQPVTVLIGSDETGGRMALVELRVRCGGGPPRHLHRWEDESLYVLEGALRVWVGGAWAHVPAGCAVFLPRDVEHAFLVVADEARILVTLTPAGFERCYQEMAEDIVAPDIERFVTTAARFGCEVTGPPPTTGDG